MFWNFRGGGRGVSRGNESGAGGGSGRAWGWGGWEGGRVKRGSHLAPPALDGSTGGAPSRAAGSPGLFSINASQF